MSKISIVLGRGLEGCGVTKYTVELEKWLVSNNHTVTVYADKSKKWTRKDSHNLLNLILTDDGFNDLHFLKQFFLQCAFFSAKLY